MKPMIAALLLLALPGAATAQPPHGPDPRVAQEKIAALSVMIGKWQGAGWTLTPGGRAEFTSSEEVVRELGGVALLVRGKHFDKARPEVAVHDALAVISWNPRGQTYRMSSWLANGAGGDFPLTATADGFTWTIEAPHLTMRYTASFAGGQWVETGQRSTDGGKSWVSFFEMRLSRVQ